GEIEAERLLHRRLVVRRRGRRVLLGQRRLLLAVLETAERHRLLLFLAAADDDDFNRLANRRVGDDTRQVAHILDVLAVELHHHVAGQDAGGFRRPLFIDAGDERAARRLDAEALGDVVGDLLDAHAEPAAASLAELPQLIDHRGDGLRRYREADAD